jgi:hypothetical protein
MSSLSLFGNKPYLFQGSAFIPAQPNPHFYEAYIKRSRKYMSRLFGKPAQVQV